MYSQKSGLTKNIGGIGRGKNLLLARKILQLLVELGNLLDEQVDALHDEADLQSQMLTAMAEGKGVLGGRL